MTGRHLAAGDPVPPSTTHKAWAAFLYGIGPVVLGAVIEVLHQSGTLLPGAPPWVAQVVAVTLLVLGPVASYWGTWRTPNLLLQPTELTFTETEADRNAASTRDES